MHAFVFAYTQCATPERYGKLLMANINYTETEAAQAIQAVLPDSRWIGTGLQRLICG